MKKLFLILTLLALSPLAHAIDFSCTYQIYYSYMDQEHPQTSIQDLNTSGTFETWSGERKRIHLTGKVSKLDYSFTLFLSDQQAVVDLNQTVPGDPIPYLVVSADTYIQYDTTSNDLHLASIRLKTHSCGTHLSIDCNSLKK